LYHNLIGGNKIGVEGAKDIANALTTNKSLTDLHLGKKLSIKIEYNTIGEEGAGNFANNKISLRYLNISTFSCFIEKIIMRLRIKVK
jgi:hypothetical protein